MNKELQFKVAFSIFLIILILFAMSHIVEYYSSFTVYELPGISYPFNQYLESIDINFDMKDYDEGILYLMPFLSLSLIILGLILMLADIKLYIYTFVGISIVRFLHLLLIWNYLSTKLFLRVLDDLYLEFLSIIIVGMFGIAFAILFREKTAVES